MGRRRRPCKPSGGLFVEGGLLSGWKESRRFPSSSPIQGHRSIDDAGEPSSSSKSRRWKACNYSYPDSSMVEPDNPPADVLVCDSSPGSFSEPHLGLGFQREGRDEEISRSSEGSSKRNPGFLSIGGLKLYTEDISSPDDDDSDPEEESEGASDDDDDDDDDDNGDDDVDDELVQDYLQGVGGTDELLKVLQCESLDYSSSSDSGDDSAGKLGPIALMNASREYGMKKVGGKGKGSENARRVSSNWEELMPSRGQKSDFSRRGRHDKKIRGEKKKQRRESIARKRRERALNRGVDLQQINLELKRMVLSETDMFAFQPMDSRDCAQVQRLASIYRLQSGCQGSGKKRFVTVVRTCHTSLPTSNDIPRLEKFLGFGEKEQSDYSVDLAQGGSKGRSSSGKAKAKKNPSDKEGSSGKARRPPLRPVYADNPVSFVSSGVMQTGQEEPSMAASPPERPDNTESRLGAFELHTKGFGSRMMAKMGFSEGTGLGRDGQGIVRPIEPVRRPKSLGLGVQFEASDVEQGAASEKTPLPKPGKSLGLFEQHTTGFGSKMMAKMGYLPGAGLGKDAQGITTPLPAVKLPKSRGLGSSCTR